MLSTRVILLIFQSVLLIATGVVESYLPRNSCPSLELPNGRIRIRSRGHIARFNCFRPYVLVGDNVASCVKGEWNIPTPFCAKTGCRKLDKLMHGELISNYRGAVVRPICDSGFELIGSKLLYCRGTSWNDSLPVCQAQTFDQFKICNFEPDETEQCNWINKPSVFTWRVYPSLLSSFSSLSSKNNKNLSAPNTHPTFDHTLAPHEGGHYLYLESNYVATLSLIRHVNMHGGVAKYVSPLLPAIVDDKVEPCLIFWYYMYGRFAGRVRINVGNDTVWEKLGNQGNKWQKALIKFRQQPNAFHVVIEGAGVLGHYSNTAIDDLKITTGPECDKSPVEVLAYSVEPEIPASELKPPSAPLNNRSIAESRNGTSDTMENYFIDDNNSSLSWQEFVSWTDTNADVTVPVSSSTLSPTLPSEVAKPITITNSSAKSLNNSGVTLLSKPETTIIFGTNLTGWTKAFPAISATDNDRNDSFPSSIIDDVTYKSVVLSTNNYDNDSTAFSGIPEIHSTLEFTNDDHDGVVATNEVSTTTTTSSSLTSSENVSSSIGATGSDGSFYTITLLQRNDDTSLVDVSTTPVTINYRPFSSTLHGNIATSSQKIDVVKAQDADNNSVNSNNNDDDDDNNNNNNNNNNNILKNEIDNNENSEPPDENNVAMSGDASKIYNNANVLSTLSIDVKDDLSTTIGKIEETNDAISSDDTISKLSNNTVSKLSNGTISELSNNVISKLSNGMIPKLSNSSDSISPIIMDADITTIKPTMATIFEVMVPIPSTAIIDRDQTDTDEGSSNNNNNNNDNDKYDDIDNKDDDTNANDVGKDEISTSNSTISSHRRDENKMIEITNSSIEDVERTEMNNGNRPMKQATTTTISSTDIAKSKQNRSIVIQKNNVTDYNDNVDIVNNNTDAVAATIASTRRTPRIQKTGLYFDKPKYRGTLVVALKPRSSPLSGNTTDSTDDIADRVVTELPTKSVSSSNNDGNNYNIVAMDSANTSIIERSKNNELPNDLGNYSTTSEQRPRPDFEGTRVVQPVGIKSSTNDVETITDEFEAASRYNRTKPTSVHTPLEGGISDDDTDDSIKIDRSDSRGVSSNGDISGYDNNGNGSKIVKPRKKKDKLMDYKHQQDQMKIAKSHHHHHQYTVARNKFSFPTSTDQQYPTDAADGNNAFDVVKQERERNDISENTLFLRDDKRKEYGNLLNETATYYLSAGMLFVSVVILAVIMYRKKYTKITQKTSIDLPLCDSDRLELNPVKLE